MEKTEKRPDIRYIPAATPMLSQVLGGAYGQEGIRSGDLIVISGRSGMGKSLLARQFVTSAALSGTTAALITMEEPYPVKSMIGNVAFVGMGAPHLNGVIDTIGQILKENERQGWPLRFVAIDSLQLMSFSHECDDRQAAKEVAVNLKGLAVELELPIALVTEHPKDVDRRIGKDKRPLLQDFSFSCPALMEVPDQVILINRPEVYNREDESLKGLAELIVAKNRRGPTGLIQTEFKPTAPPSFFTDSDKWQM